MPRNNLLLVDSDSKNRRVLEVSLKKAGFNVTTAVGGLDALSKLVTTHPDLIISDTELAEMNGFEFCAQVRERSDWQDVPFIFLTREDSMQSRVQALELGVNDYLTKPVYVRELLLRVRLLLEKNERAHLADIPEERGESRLFGDLSDMGVVDLLQLIRRSDASGIAVLESSREREGSIYFREGAVIDAEYRHLHAEPAVYRMLTWSEGTFDVLFREVRRQQVISTSVQALLMEGMRRLDEWGRLLEQLPSLTTQFRVDLPELHRRLSDLPDEMNALLRLIDGETSLIGLIDGAGMPDLVCLESVSKLYFEGILVECDAPAVEEWNEEKTAPYAKLSKREAERRARAALGTADPEPEGNEFADEQITSDVDTGVRNRLSRPITKTKAPPGALEMLRPADDDVETQDDPDFEAENSGVHDRETWRPPFARAQADSSPPGRHRLLAPTKPYLEKPEGTEPDPEEADASTRQRRRSKTTPVIFPVQGTSSGESAPETPSPDGESTELQTAHSLEAVVDQVASEESAGAGKKRASGRRRTDPMFRDRQSTPSSPTPPVPDEAEEDAAASKASADSEPALSEGSDAVANGQSTTEESAASLAEDAPTPIPGSMTVPETSVSDAASSTRRSSVAGEVTIADAMRASKAAEREIVTIFPGDPAPTRQTRTRRATESLPPPNEVQAVDDLDLGDGFDESGQLEPIAGLDSDLESGFDLVEPTAPKEEASDNERFQNALRRRRLMLAQRRDSIPPPQEAASSESEERKRSRESSQPKPRGGTRVTERVSVPRGFDFAANKGVGIAAVAGVAVVAFLFVVMTRDVSSPSEKQTTPQKEPVAAFTSDEAQAPPPAPTPAQVRAELEQAQAFAKEGRIAQALQLVSGSHHAESASALELLARLRFQRGDLQDALEAANAAVILSPSSPEIWWVKAMAHRELGHLDKARGAFQKYLDLRPKGRNAASVRRILSKL